MDVEKLLRLLKENKVRFVIIGATAFPVYGYSRSTLDIDIFIEAKLPNAEKVRRAMSEFGYDVSDITVEDLLTKKVLVREYTVQADFHPFVEGATFDEVWARKIKAKLGDTFAWFASLGDLIKMKKAAGRAKDIEDLKYLLKLKRKWPMSSRHIRRKKTRQ
jgi:predicted nucleotidyltransferase